MSENLLNKLNYLKDTKIELRAVLEEMGATVTDEDTFRSYVEKLKGTTPDTNYIRKLTAGETYIITDELGEVEIYEDSFICPKIIVDESYEDTFMVPFSPQNKIGAYSSANIMDYVDFRNVMTGPNGSVTFYLKMIKPATLVLPDNCELPNYTVVNAASGYDSSSFTRGLIFGKSVRSSNTSWLSRALNTTKRTVYFPQDFKMDEGSTLYLSRIYMTADSIHDMVPKLYTYTDGTTRTISVGSTNMNLFTDEELNLAELKGWIIQS